MPSQEFQNLRQRSLFARLKKLFSTDVIVRNIGGKQLKVVDTDEAMYATDRNTLRDRFNRVRTSAFNQYSRDFSLSYQASRIELMRDYDTMDMDPIISSALDIYADECVGGETIIPLLSGEKVTIRDLYIRNEKDFWVYSATENGTLKPEKCERVAYNGKKRMYKLTLDDNTIITCTANHQWVLSDNTVVSTDNLKFGYSLKAMSTKLSSNKFMNGYEMVKDLVESNNHRVVSVELLDGEFDAYDLVNVGNNTHLYAIETLDGSKLFTHNCITKNELGSILTVHSEDDNIKQILENLFYDILNIEFNLWSWTRNLVKYGDFYLKLHISPEYGIYMVEPVSAYNVTRVENSNMDNKAYVKFQVNLPEGGKIENIENYQMAHFRMLSDSNFLPYGKCLRGDTKVWTSTGYKNIKDIEVGEEVYCFNTEDRCLMKTKVLNSVESGRKQLYEIKTEHRTLFASEDHPILTEDNGYKIVKNLTLSDSVLLPNINDSIGELPVLKVADDELHSSTIKLDESVIINNKIEFFRFFGFMLGDGWLDKSNKTVCFSVGDRLDKSQQHIDFIKKVGLSYRITNENTTAANCVIHSVYFYKLLESLDFRTGTINKVLPSWAWKLSKSLKTAIVFGFGDADGADLELNEAYQIGSINQQLITDLRELAMQSGLSVTKIWNTLNASGSTMSLFTFRNNSRDFKKVNDDYHIEKIRSIFKSNIEETYDIQVESSYSNFVANGIVVHNSMIENGRRVWKQLSLMEDAMLIHRVMRAPEKRIFKIDVGNLPPQEIDTYMEKLMAKMQKTPYIDEQTGDYNLRFNLQNMAEDFYLPVRGGDSGTSIEPLAGMEFTGIDDIEYLRLKMMAALKIPKAFLTYDEDLSGKATLAQEDVRFAKTILRIQRILVSELQKMAIVHLYSQGYKDAALVNFTLELTNPSVVFEKEKIAAWGEKVGVAKEMMEQKLFSKKWIYNNIFHMSSDDATEVLGDVVEDSKQLFRFKQIEEEGNDPAKPFNKIKPDDGSAVAGGDEPPSSDAVSEPPEEPKPEGGPLAEKAKKPYIRPSQAGKKDASDYPFGEDHLGRSSFNSGDSQEAINKARKNENIIDFGGLKSFLNTLEKDKKDLLKETTDNSGSTVSFLDESNINDKY